uniref:Uncharacterized protein n=1 Tax=Oryza sativa subsp. japonica TaxID=39947 RepID=Q5Z611_ORYSJ|nr:hypothetical protein [Oryza sativa Japonica Group]BAD61948.1 hypothetical protein [Oryza sativa Japonica Group]
MLARPGGLLDLPFTPLLLLKLVVARCPHYRYLPRLRPAAPRPTEMAPSPRTSPKHSLLFCPTSQCRPTIYYQSRGSYGISAAFPTVCSAAQWVKSGSAEARTYPTQDPKLIACPYPLLSSDSTRQRCGWNNNHMNARGVSGPEMNLTNEEIEGGAARSPEEAGNEGDRRCRVL